MLRATLFVATCAVVLAAATPAVAEEDTLPDHRGHAEFQQYCASCHGEEADGRGPMAGDLQVPPADLRLLGQRYGMPLPRPKLVAFIDGRTHVRGHGSRAMPVWGKRLHEQSRGDQAHEGHVRGSILVIVDYLETLQLPPTEEDD